MPVSQFANQRTPRIASEKISLKVEFKAITFIYILELIFRITICWLYIFDAISIGIFLLFFIGSMVIEGIISDRYGNKLKKKLKNKIGEERLQPFSSIDIEYSAQSTLVFIYFLLGLAASYLIINKIINPEHWYGYILIIFLTLFFSVFFIVIPFFISYPKNFHPISFQATKITQFVQRDLHRDRLLPEISKDVSHQYVNQLQAIEETFDGQIRIDPIDINDKEIASLESNLKNVTSKVESYMLESVLIGSLTFSGFLTIMASVPGIAWKNVDFSALSFFGTAPASTWPEKLESWLLPQNLFPLLMFESLCCSVFFVLVLALRVRFGTLTLKLDYLIRIMVIFNAKEEEIINMELSGTPVTEQFLNRKNTLTYKISEAINDANKFMKDIMPLAKLMGLYRNIGLMLFFLILITAGLFFSTSIAFFIFLLAILTYLFRLFDAWRSIDKIERLIKRH